MKKKEINVVLDIETTGLDYRREKIIEFAAVKLVNGKITEEYETLINPEKEIRHSSIKIHGITQDMVADSPTIKEVMPKILEFIGDYPIIGHNVIFDYSFLNQASLELYEKPLENHRIDSQVMFRDVFPEEFSHGLDALMRRFKVEVGTRHRAMADTKGLALAYPGLKKLYNEKFKWQLSQIENINYLFERYLRIQQSVQILQAELGDIKNIFKFYFEEDGKEIESTTGELLTYQSKPVYTYNVEQLRSVLEEIGAFDRAVKLNNGLIDRMIDGTSLDESIKQKLSLARTKMTETRSVNIIKPDKGGFITNNNNG